jgi:hypothetical protein
MTRIVRERATDLFLLPEDENALAEAIRRDFPEVAFLDESHWVDPSKPPVRAGVLQCGWVAGFWNQDIYPTIRGRRRANGRVDGPEAEVVQWLRSLVRSPGILSHGRWAYALPAGADPRMAAFVDRVWRILLAQTTNRMRRVSAADPNAPERRFRVGAQAFRQAAEGRLVLAADALRLAPESGFRWPRQ